MNPADEIPEACHADWEAMPKREGGRRRYCDACRTEVWDLSAMREAEAQAFLEATRGQAICMAVTLDGQGQPIYRQPDPLVPASRLSRAARVAAQRAGPALLATALVACAPHGQAEAMPELEEAPSLAERLDESARIPLRSDAEAPCDPESGSAEIETSEAMKRPPKLPPKRRVGRRPAKRVKKGGRRAIQRDDPLG